MKYLKSISITIGICLIVLLITLFAANYFIKSSATDLTFDKIENIPDNQVGLLLGTSKTLSNGYSNYYFKYRIDATVDLFKNNKIKYLIMIKRSSIKDGWENAQFFLKKFRKIRD